MEPYNRDKHYEGIKKLIRSLEVGARKRNDTSDIIRLEHIANAVEVLNHYTVTNDVTEYPGIRQRDADVVNMQKERKEHPNLELYVVALDLDNFGEFNKKYGQEIGDEVLRTTMGILQESLREYDVVGKSYHPHGEEIDIILQAPNKGVAALIVNRLRKDLEQKSAEIIEGNHTITGTFGFTPWAIEQEEYGVAKKRADDAMKEGKKEIKNRVYFQSSNPNL